MKKGSKGNHPKEKKGTIERTKKRVAAYARVSTEKDEQLHSLQSQREHFESFIKSNKDWEFVEIYYDEGITGTSLRHRDGFNRMIDDAMNGKIDVILVKSVSRYARNTLDALKTTRDLKVKGIPVYFEKENVDTLDPKGEFMLTLYCAFTQEKSKSISENIKWAKRRGYKERKADFPYSHLIGITKSRSSSKITIDKDGAKIVRLIYKLFFEGYGMQCTVEKLRELNVPTTTGLDPSHWTTNNILSILSNEKYCGDVIRQKKFTIDPILHTSKMNEGELPQYRIYNNHPA